MLEIDKSIISNEVKKSTAKKERGFSNPVLRANYIRVLKNFNEYASSLNSYELGNLINNFTMFFLEKNQKVKPDRFPYKIGTICMVDMGVMNNGYELCYPHPCVIVAQTKDFALIAPCSSSKSGKSHRDIFECSTQDGFLENTGIIMDNFRWIAKNRILYRVGMTKLGFVHRLRQEIVRYIHMDLDKFMV
jgi:hypothetical protein